MPYVLKVSRLSAKSSAEAQEFSNLAQRMIIEFVPEVKIVFFFLEDKIERVVKMMGFAFADRGDRRREDMDSMFYKNSSQKRRSYNFENMTSEKGRGGMENDGAKGHAFDTVAPKSERVIFDVEGSGVIDHIWFTLSTPAGQLDPMILRGMKIEMYWDHAKTPAVSAPLGDFFGISLAKVTEFENALFSCPSGKAFNCYLQMPFLKAGKIVLVNETDVLVTRFFYSVDYYLDDTLDAGKMMYLHANWRREERTVLKKDFEVLPRVRGNGRFLGVNFGVISNTEYPETWWGEGEMKFYLDGDKEYPTVAGTGAEDYIGTGWGMRTFSHQYQGSLISEGDTFCFYRYHIPDPIYFTEDCRVTIQQIGGAPRSVMLKLKDTDAKFDVVSLDLDVKGFVKMYEQKPPLAFDDDSVDENAWCNFYREDDFCATAYFYLDNPEGVLPTDSTLEERIAGLELDGPRSKAMA